MPPPRRPRPPRIPSAVQQRVSADEGVLQARLDRLAADRDLHLELGLRSYSGRLWKCFERTMAEYGQSVMGGWIRTGKVFQECRAKKIPVMRSALLPRDIEVDDMATDIVVASIPAFRDEVLIPGVWNAEKGASLRTFFVGQCLFHFPNIYRAWVTSTKALMRTRLGNHDDVALELEDLSAEGASLELRVELRLQLLRIEAANDQDVRRREALVAMSDAMGLENQEIGERLAMTARAVEAVLYRRRKAR